MATIHGGMFHAVPVATHVTPVARPDAGPLSLASVTPQGTGGAPQDQAQFAGSLPAGSDQVVATQSQDGGNTTVHLHDGSTITFVGIAHIDAIIH